MQYDPIKDIFASVLKRLPFLRVFFFKLLDLMFLRSWFVRRELINIRKIFNDKKINIYDAGCGYGQYSFFMKKKLLPNNIFAVDVKENWINDCREFFQKQKIEEVSFGIEDLTEINHKEKFELIVCVDVMEHILDDVKVFKNFYNALKPNGYLLINTPSIFGGSDVHDEGEESFVGEHARIGYSREELNQKLNPLGFKEYKSIYTYGFWGDIGWRLGIKYPMLILNFSKILLIFLPIYYLITFPFTFLFMLIDFNSTNKIGTGITFIAQK